MNDLRLAFSQIGSSYILFEFTCIFVKMNCVCKFEALPYEFGGCSFWQEWDMHKIGGKLERFPQLM
jgi:hypothetical protein